MTQLHSEPKPEGFLDKSTEPPIQEQSPEEACPYNSKFVLRGAFKKNPMLDAACGLFALANRLETVETLENVQRLYNDVSNEIRTILLEMRQHAYDEASVKAYSYSLCLFMDERVMSRPWGVDSVWSHHPLLSEFHKETWGGEKFFTLLERLCNEAAKYQHVLEFMYYAVCLGLRGKYAVREKGEEEIKKIIVRLHRIIRELRGPAPPFPSHLHNVAPRNLRLDRQWPWWSPWLIAALAMAAIYTAYSMRLNSITQEVLKSLEPILKL